MSRVPTLLFGVAAASVALDQWTKVWATTNLAFHEPIHVVGDLVRLTYTRNSGIAFGLFAGQSFPFYIFSIVAAVAVLWLWFRHPQLPAARQWSLALILGGAIGNLIDRLRFGEVTDFILLAWRGHEFPVFNVADMCVTFGVILFALVWSHDPHTPHPATSADIPVDPAASPGATESSEEIHGPHAGAGGAGYGGGSPLGPVAGERTDRGPVA
jgi:signal peptidase II